MTDFAEDLHDIAQETHDALSSAATQLARLSEKLHAVSADLADALRHIAHQLSTTALTTDSTGA
jgi:uncharacterized protein YukE